MIVSEREREREVTSVMPTRPHAHGPLLWRQWSCCKEWFHSEAITKNDWIKESL